MLNSSNTISKFQFLLTNFHFTTLFSVHSLCQCTVTEHQFGSQFIHAEEIAHQEFVIKLFLLSETAHHHTNTSNQRHSKWSREMCMTTAMTAGAFYVPIDQSFVSGTGTSLYCSYFSFCIQRLNEPRFEISTTVSPESHTLPEHCLQRGKKCPCPSTLGNLQPATVASELKFRSPTVVWKFLECSPPRLLGQHDDDHVANFLPHRQRYPPPGGHLDGSSQTH